MALFSLDIEKRLGNEFWTNRYVLNATDIAGAVSVGATIVGYEREVHFSHVTFNKYRVSTLAADDDVFTIVPLVGGGSIDAAGLTPLPLWNVARVDFGAATGRPSRKYLRMGLTENGVDGNVLTSSMLSVLNAYGAALVALDAYVDVDNQAIVSYAVFSLVAMRQLRRGTRRRTTPVLP